ncbi:transposase family protein [Roseiconus lacunae]|uniref:transposase family protein n=1 Tax=Roseiconus lacunae TaxID=2605694 RepID=UPI0036F3D85F
MVCRGRHPLLCRQPSGHSPRPCRGAACCPECSKQCARYDTAPERTWRHLDTMQFKTDTGDVIESRVVD